MYVMPDSLLAHTPHILPCPAALHQLPGTEKYPAENHYKQFLSKHGGSSNASTSMETTVYKFDVNHAHFEEALDIFR